MDQSYFVCLQGFRRIRGHLSKAAITVANALVSSRLDYCNSLFRGLSCNDLKKLQCVQNSLSRIVSNSSWFSHVTPVLKSLHWLPIKYRSIYKTLTIIYKHFNTGLPNYFNPHILAYVSSVNVRRSNPSNRFLLKPIYSSSTHKSKVHFNRRPTT